MLSAEKRYLLFIAACCRLHGELNFMTSTRSFYLPCSCTGFHTDRGRITRPVWRSVLKESLQTRHSLRNFGNTGRYVLYFSLCDIYLYITRAQNVKSDIITPAQNVESDIIKPAQSVASGSWEKGQQSVFFERLTAAEWWPNKRSRILETSLFHNDSTGSKMIT